MQTGGDRIALADADAHGSTSFNAVVMGQDAHAASAVRAMLESSGVAASTGHSNGKDTASIGVIAVVIHPDDAAWREAVQHGLPRLMVFDGEPDEAALVEALRQGATGAISTVALNLLVRAMLPPEGLAPVLTPREIDILRSIDDGKSVKETAEALGISPRTVDNVQRFLFTKLGVRNRKEAVARCRALGLLDLDGGG